MSNGNLVFRTRINPGVHRITNEHKQKMETEKMVRECNLVRYTAAKVIKETLNYDRNPVVEQTAQEILNEVSLQ